MRSITRFTAAIATAIVASTTLLAAGGPASAQDRVVSQAGDFAKRCESFDFDTPLQIDLVDTHLFRNGRPFIAEVVNTDVVLCWFEDADRIVVDPGRSTSRMNARRVASGVDASALTWQTGWASTPFPASETELFYSSQQGLRIHDRAVDRSRFSRIELQYTASFFTSVTIDDSFEPGQSRTVVRRMLCLRMENVNVVRTNRSIDDVTPRGQRQQCRVIDREVSFD